MLQNGVPSDCSFLQLHSFILAQQILLAIHILNSRLSKAKQDNTIDSIKTDTNITEIGHSEEQCSTLQLRHNFSTIIFRYTYECIERISDELLLLKVI